MGMQGAHMLLVEDDEVLRDVVVRNLRARNYEVSIAGTAQRALQLLQVITFDLIFLDIDLPDQTGWDVLRTAQQNGSLQLQQIGDGEPYLPVVVLSAVRVSPRRLAEFHTIAYLPKPFPMDALLRLAAEVSQRKEIQTPPVT
jgi:CheY-like chemotaxis protein